MAKARQAKKEGSTRSISQSSKRAKSNTTTKKAGEKKEAKNKASKVYKRDASGFAGLDPHGFSKAKQQAHDIDYVSKLSPQEKEWLSRFMDEYLGARLNHPGKKMHKSKKDRKMVFDANNARNRDIHSVWTRWGDDTNVVRLLEEGMEGGDFEEAFIDFLDYKSQNDIE